MTERGFVLATVLAFVALLSAMALALLRSAHLATQAEREIAGGSVALAAADAGVAHLHAASVPGSAFLVDDLPREGSTFPLPGPGGYEIASLSLDGDWLVGRVVGRGPRGARREVEARFRRASAFRPPAPFLVGALSRPARLDGPISIDPMDDRPAMVAEREVEAAALSIPVSGDLGLSSALGEILAGSRSVDGPVHGASWVDEAIRVHGNATFTGDVSVRGILASTAPLRVRGDLVVEGVVLAAGGLDVSGSLEVEGALWVRSELDALPGSEVRIAWSPQALDAADLAAPGLPRSTILGGWREVW